jgi:hypothetical protein
MRRASFRMPSDKTLRVTLVSTLPLLHFSPSLVAVVPRLSVIRRVTYARSIFSSSSAPAFRLDSTRVKARLGSSSLRGYTASAVFTVESVLNSPFVGLPVGIWVILRSGHNPSSLFTPAHRHFVRHFILEGGLLEFRILNYLLRFKLPFSSFQQRFPRYFPRVQILDTHVSASGYGPGLSNLAKTPCIGMVFDVTLCSFHTAQRLSRLDPDSLPCFLRRTSSNQDSHSSFFVHRHLYVPVLRGF